jgi:hypothetical protein
MLTETKGGSKSTNTPGMPAPPAPVGGLAMSEENEEENRTKDNNPPPDHELVDRELENNRVYSSCSLSFFFFLFE